MSRLPAALVLFALVVAASFHGVVAHPGSRIPQGFDDATGTLRDYWAASVQHRNPLDFHHDALIGAPQGVERAPATTLANGGVQTAFVWGLRGPLGLVGAWNAFLLLGLLATSAAMFAFLDWLGCTFIAALFGALVFAFSPYAFERAYAGHLGLLHNWIFVLLAFALVRLHERRSPGWAVTAGAAMVVAFYLSAYQGLLALLMTLVYAVVELVRRRERSQRLRPLVLAGAAYAVTALGLIPILVLYAREHATVGQAVSHDPRDVYRYAASISAYLLPSPRNPLFHWLRGIHPSDLTEQTLYFGYTTALLALVAVALLRRGDPWFSTGARRWTALFAAVLVPAAFVLSLAPRKSVGSLSVPMPSAAIGVFSTFWRVYSRFGLLVGFGLAVLAATALTALAARGGLLRLVAPVALLLVVLELLPGNMRAFDTTARPDWVAWLAKQPAGSVATYPIDLYDFNRKDDWYQRLDGHPRFELGIFGSVGGIEYSRERAVRLVAGDLGDPLAPGILSTEHVRYVVVHDDLYRANHRALPRPDPARFRLLRRFGSVRVYSVHAPKLDIAAALRARQFRIALLQGLTPPGLAYGDGFNAPEQYHGSQSRWLIEDGTVNVDNSGPAMDVLVTGFTFSNQRPRTLEVENASGRVLARQPVSTSEVPLALGPVRIPHGHSSLALVAVPGPEPLSASDRREASVFLSAVVLRPTARFDDGLR